jgi:hypothetical protein
MEAALEHGGGLAREGNALGIGGIEVDVDGAAPF